MKTNAWQKHVPRAATFDRFEKMLKGMSGYGANRDSTTKNKPMVTAPKMIKHSTMAEVQGCEIPPYSRPRRSIIVPETIVKEPSQSTAFNPLAIGVFGV